MKDRNRHSLLWSEEECLISFRGFVKTHNSERKLIVMYVVLPLVILSFSLGALMVFSDSGYNDSNVNTLRAFATLDAKPVSLMSPDTSGNLYNEMNSIKGLFAQYNQEYGSRLSINVVTGTSATPTQMMTYITTTERMHLSGHGTWSSNEGPKITMYGGYLTWGLVSAWSLGSGKCKFIYLSACNSMGHDGILDTKLVYELQSKTSAQAVIGFKDVVNIVAATLLSQSFWGFHVTYSYIGGISTDGSYINTRARIQGKIDFINALIALSVGFTLASGIGELVGLAMSVEGAAFVSALLSSVTGIALYIFLLGDIQAALNNWEVSGSSVPGLYWPSGGGGGGGKPPINVPY